jgi:hypothetical protein
MKRSVVAILILFLTTPLFCQMNRLDTLSNSSSRFFQPKKFDYGVTLGSEFSSMSGFGSALKTYVTPHVTYNLNKRLSIGGGFSIIQTNYFGAKPYFQSEQNAFSNGSYTSAMLFVNGQYIVNERLTVSGSAFKQFPITKDPLPYNPFNPVSSNGAQGIDFNVVYKVGRNVYIQAGFRYTDGVNPYNTNRYYSDPFQSGSFVPGAGFGCPRW